MRKYAAPVILLLLLPILGQYALRAIRAVKPSIGPSLGPTEEQWLIEEVGRDLAEMALFASAGHDAKPEAVQVTSVGGTSTGPSLRVALPGKATLEHPMSKEAWVWSPEEYTPLAARLLESLGVASLAPTPDRGGDQILLQALLDARAGPLEEQNELLSAHLEAAMADPHRHENAALLLGAFALREAADTFSDTRQILCRMAAHLAMARALRGTGPGGTTGRCAEAILLVLANRGEEAEKAVASLEPFGAEGDSAVRGWQRVLRLRLTQDWRDSPPGPRPFLERVERFRAKIATLGVARAQQGLAEPDEDPSPTLGQLALEGNPDVATGNRLLPKVLEDTVLQATTHFTLIQGKAPASEAELVAALSAPAERFWSRSGPRIIAWGTWAAMFQRHLCALVTRSDRQVRNALDLEQEANELAEELDRRFGKLTLYPFVALRRAKSAEYKVKPIDAAVGVVIRQPELVSAASWSAVATATPDEAQSYGLPDRTRWFGAGCPRGTAYEFDRRSESLGMKGGELALALLSKVAPGDFHIAHAILEAKKSYTSADLDLARKLFGTRLQYDRRAMLRLSQLSEWSDPGATRSIRETMCAITPRDCFLLGNLLVEAGEEADAVPAFERGLAEEPDALEAAYHSSWLVSHYLASGHRARAEALARHAGAVYSAAGLEVLASYLEKTGDFAGAESTLRAAQTRYPDGDFKPQLLGLYHRVGHLRKVSAYEAKFRGEARELFPHGLERVALTSFTSPPTDGARIQNVSPALHRAHIQGGEVIVALDGFRVHSPEQYAVVREFDDSPEVRWIVWRASSYREVTLRSIDRRFHFDMHPYPVSR